MTELTKQEERTTVPNVKSLTLDSSSSTQRNKSLRRIFEVDEGHRSKQTAIKYRNNFDHFLNFVRIRDLDVFLDLGKEAIQELVINYVLSMRDDAEKMYSRSTDKH